MKIGKNTITIIFIITAICSWAGNILNFGWGHPNIFNLLLTLIFTASFAAFAYLVPKGRTVVYILCGCVLASTVMGIIGSTGADIGWGIVPVVVFLTPFSGFGVFPKTVCYILIFAVFTCILGASIYSRKKVKENI